MASAPALMPLVKITSPQHGWYFDLSATFDYAPNRLQLRLVMRWTTNLSGAACGIIAVLLVTISLAVWILSLGRLTVGCGWLVRGLRNMLRGWVAPIALIFAHYPSPNFWCFAVNTLPICWKMAMRSSLAWCHWRLWPTQSAVTLTHKPPLKLG